MFFSSQITDVSEASSWNEQAKPADNPTYQPCGECVLINSIEKSVRRGWEMGESQKNEGERGGAERREL